MRMAELTWEDWRAVIGVLRAKALPYMLEHTDHIERLLEQHAPDEATVRLSLTDIVFLRSYNWARVQLGIPLPSARFCMLRRGGKGFGFFTGSPFGARLPHGQHSTRCGPLCVRWESLKFRIGFAPQLSAASSPGGEGRGSGPAFCMAATWTRRV